MSAHLPLETLLVIFGDLEERRDLVSTSLIEDDPYGPVDDDHWCHSDSEVNRVRTLIMRGAVAEGYDDPLQILENFPSLEMLALEDIDWDVDPHPRTKSIQHVVYSLRPMRLFASPGAESVPRCTNCLSLLWVHIAEDMVDALKELIIANERTLLQIHLGISGDHETDTELWTRIALGDCRRLKDFGLSVHPPNEVSTQRSHVISHFASTVPRTVERFKLYLYVHAWDVHRQTEIIDRMPWLDMNDALHTQQELMSIQIFLCRWYHQDDYDTIDWEGLRIQEPELIERRVEHCEKILERMPDVAQKVSILPMPSPPDQ
ncbi:hypothetical protein NM688_g549 [Phlebia brevispora]|uniref:Uncharacterized protein n=1 Tax=Phlebia brevispora TaxID=194682 RepID=A0ACC1TE90_9APHY|nr:hypothetical protein NM688_g549 [Phlebia brevispora]